MRNLFFRFDPGLILPTFLLLAFSLLMISSTSQELAFQQLLFALIGLLIFFALSQLDYRYFKSFGYLMYFLSIISLVALPFIGEEIRGSTRWIEFSFFRFQPSELAKISLILALAAFFSERNLSIKNTALSVLLTIPIFALILRQPDLGSAIVILFIYLIIIFITGFPKTLLFSGTIIVIFLLPVLFNFLAPYQKDRIITFLNPAHDPLGTGYSVIQSEIAVGSGQIFGRGFGRGSQSHLAFLPERQTDFIFATLSEELGLIGAIALVTLFAILLVSMIKIAKSSKDRFAVYAATGIFGWFFSQIMINIGMNLGIFPVTGITLPLISYGGSSLVTLMIALGIISSISRSKISDHS